MTTGRDSDAIEHTRAAERGLVRAFASGRYMVRKLLGEGGQKTVYLVHDTTLERDCALSLLKAEALDPDSLSRVLREAQAMARLAHPNIVTVHDFGDEEGPDGQRRPYIVCEYMSGGDLSQELRRAGGPVALERALAIAADIAQALAAAHERGIIHRDVKPANVWLSDPPPGSGRAGSAKLGDFGIAVALDRARLTMTGMVTGTAAYMAPEQAQGAEVDGRSDLYSLGCLLYELVTGRPPFLGDGLTAVISQHIHAAPAVPSRYAKVPEALDTLILRLLAKAPEERPGSAAEVAEELRRIAGRSTQEPPPASPPEAEVRGLRRLWANRAFRAAVAVFVAGVIGGGVAGALLLNRAGGGGENGVPALVSQKVSIRLHLEGTGQQISGNCLAEDLVLQGNGEGEVTGDIPGHITATGDNTYYAAKACQEGFASSTFTLTDAKGNKIFGTLSSPLSVTISREAGDLIGATSGSAQAISLTGGTGIYEGISGTGACNAVTVGRLKPDGSVTFRTDGGCTVKATTAGAAAAATEPLIVQLGASPLRVAVAGRSGALPDTVVLAVIYRNTREVEQRGLSLRLPVPDGAEILAGSRTEKQPPPASERTWALPDLAPGDIQRFEFTLQFLKTAGPTVPLVVEVQGDGFEKPVRSDPVTIEVVQ